MTNTYTKLRDGSWGVRLDHEVRKGTETDVRVTKKSGETKVESIVVLWSGKGISLAKIVGSSSSNRRSSNRSYSRFGGKRERFGDDEGSSFPCHVCGKFCYSGDNGYCKNDRY